MVKGNRRVGNRISFSCDADDKAMNNVLMRVMYGVQETWSRSE